MKPKIEMTEQELVDDVAREDDHMLIRRFVASVGYDYIQHHKKHTAQIHPDFSEDTLRFWHEIEERMSGTVTLNFDREKCLDRLEEEAKKQAELCKEADYASSYHYGLKNGFWDSYRIVEECVTKGGEDEAI